MKTVLLLFLLGFKPLRYFHFTETVLLIGCRKHSGEPSFVKWNLSTMINIEIFQTLLTYALLLPSVGNVLTCHSTKKSAYKHPLLKLHTNEFNLCHIFYCVFHAFSAYATLFHTAIWMVILPVSGDIINPHPAHF